MRSKDGWGKKLHERHVETLLRFRYHRGWSAQRLAERYGITIRCVYAIINKVIWKDIEVVA